MRIVQLSDPHVRIPGDPLAGRVETLPYLERAISAVERLRPRPDLVLLTGDVVDTGTAAEYRLARTALERLTLPLFLLPGNHDERGGCREHLGAWLGEVRADDSLAYLVDRFPVRVVALDSVIPGRGEGRLGSDQLEWLSRQLAAGRERPALLALHHPPFEVGIGFMDRLGLTDSEELARVIAGYPQVIGVVAGHVHRTVLGRVGPAVALTAPSTAHQIPLDLTPDGPETFVFEPPGYLLHEWTGKMMRSHHAYVGDYGRRHPFR
jgi:3',5'-cyclic-AMP phosphodiesterase